MRNLALNLAPFGRWTLRDKAARAAPVSSALCVLRIAYCVLRIATIPVHHEMARPCGLSPLLVAQ